jgi:hypothetical protein
MASKKPFYEFMREFIAEYPDEVDQLTAEQLAERTGYSLSSARGYLTSRARSREEDQIRAQEANAVSYVTSSGKATVEYYPLLGDVQITSTYRRKRVKSYYWRDPPLLLTPEDTLEIGIYLLGLQPHIREVLARKDKAIPQEPIEADGRLVEALEDLGIRDEGDYPIGETPD